MKKLVQGPAELVASQLRLLLTGSWLQIAVHSLHKSVQEPLGLARIAFTDLADTVRHLPHLLLRFTQRTAGRGTFAGFVVAQRRVGEAQYQHGGKGQAPHEKPPESDKP